MPSLFNNNNKNKNMQKNQSRQRFSNYFNVKQMKPRQGQATGAHQAAQLTTKLAANEWDSEK
ncbi:hypothetical protein T08_5980 [Trichinella sp. T8]|nr:hypothetical protein T08_5980 [Trichinella sp. T8]